jgi:hypothetical protein
VAQYVNCPQCGGSNVAKPWFTWWGGVVGQHLLTHVKCNDCKTAFNGKTGQSNTSAIIIYCVVVSVVFFVPLFFLLQKFLSTYNELLRVLNSGAS